MNNLKLFLLIMITKLYVGKLYSFLLHKISNFVSNSWGYLHSALDLHEEKG